MDKFLAVCALLKFFTYYERRKGNEYAAQMDFLSEVCTSITGVNRVIGTFRSVDKLHAYHITVGEEGPSFIVSDAGSLGALQELAEHLYLTMPHLLVSAEPDEDGRTGVLVGSGDNCKLLPYRGTTVVQVDSKVFETFVRIVTPFVSKD